MSDPVSILLVARATERVLIILVGGLCISFGWRLFSKRLAQDGEAELAHDKTRLRLRRIGPGVFFALFGASLLAFSLAKPVTVEITENATLSKLVSNAVVFNTGQTNGSAVSRSISIRGAGEDMAVEQLRRDVRALNTALRVAGTDRKDAMVLHAALGDLDAAKSQLASLRSSMVVRALGAEEFQFWERNRAQFASSPASFSADDRMRIGTVQSWMDETLADE